MTHIFTLLFLSTFARADIGPKPSAYFEWPSHKGVSLGSVQLLQCKDAACREAAPLQQIGPQRFSCCEAGCFAMAYGFADTSQLSAEIDGKEVKSAPFSITKPDGFFVVSSTKGRLEVHAVRGLSNERKNALENCK